MHNFYESPHIVGYSSAKFSKINFSVASVLTKHNPFTYEAAKKMDLYDPNSLSIPYGFTKHKFSS